MEWLILVASAGSLVASVLALARLRQIEDAIDPARRRAEREVQRRRVLRIHDGGW